MACPLCAASAARPSWLGAVRYAGSTFPYVECCSCGSLYCDPMPGAETLARMYGPHYVSEAQGENWVEDPKEPGRTIEWLQKLPAGTFMDYGCGQGLLLGQARRLGWHAMGFELDAEVARRTHERTECEVLSDPDLLATRYAAGVDVLHLGDVIEHLTDPDHQMPTILNLVKPGGILLAQGPLENHANLFTWVLRKARSARPNRITEMPPYHVLLATSAGQREFFSRFGLMEIEYRMREVHWPAPSRLSMAVLRSPRALSLYVLRQISRGVSALRPQTWGNRYYYAGRWNGTPGPA